MSWIVNVDLNTESIAPAIFARWIASSGSVTLVHVVDDVRASMATAEEKEQISAGAHGALATIAQQAGLDPEKVDIQVGLGKLAEDFLSELAQAREAQGIITARVAAYGEDRIVHLGKTARRLLRRLPVPVIAVPPELVSEGIGAGPVVLAGDGHHDARRAKAFCLDVGGAVGRETHLVHAYPESFKPANSGLPASAWAGMYERYQAQQHDKLERWIGAYDLGGLQVHEVQGDAVASLVTVGRRLETPLVACASRELDAASRLFNSSTGSQLASLAPFAVAVVPM